jgi:hypothetical protein
MVNTIDYLRYASRWGGVVKMASLHAIAIVSHALKVQVWGLASVYLELSFLVNICHDRASYGALWRIKKTPESTGFEWSK